MLVIVLVLDFPITIMSKSNTTGKSRSCSLGRWT
jgi:hypothetical protein